MSTVLRLDGISKSFVRGLPVLQDVSLQVDRGEMVCLLGPSGCGKTTLLRLIAGFETPSSGTISLAGEVVSAPGHVLPPEARHVGMVFQDYALFPHLTVGQNIQFGLVDSSVREQCERLAEVLELVDLQESAERYPHELSGGQQQRAALARALAPSPQLVLLDEPFSNLDTRLRQQLRHELRDILAQSETSAILVTHDHEEALSLADTLVIVEYGQVRQMASPQLVLESPRTRFVADFLDLGSFLEGEVCGDVIVTEAGLLPFPAVNNLVRNMREVDVLIRPEWVHVCTPGEGISAEVSQSSFCGLEKLYTFCLKSGATLRGGMGSRSLQASDRVQIQIVPADLLVYPR